MDTSSINPVSVIDEAIDLSTRLAGTSFLSVYSLLRFNVSSMRYTNATIIPLTTLPQLS
jgi:hypothetical protein